MQLICCMVSGMDAFRFDLDRYQTALADSETEQEARTRIFQDDPYSVCEQHLHLFSKEALLSITLGFLAPDLDIDWYASSQDQEETIAAVREAIALIEL